MNLNTVSLHGRLTDTPRLSHTSQHHLPVADAVLLVNRRVHTSRDHWDDAAPTRYCIKAWRQPATNIAALPKGAEVPLVGLVETDTHTDHDGNPHSTDTVIVDALGASLAHATLDIYPARTAQPATHIEHAE
jgi:single-strand DNA-binding protein